MRIAVIDPSLFTWPYDHELAAGLSAIGNEILVFGKVLPARHANAREPLLRQHFYPAMAMPFWDHVPKSAVRALKGVSHIGSLARLWRTLWLWRPDVIHFQWCPLPAVDGRFLPLFRRIAPIVLTVHDTMPFNGAPGSSLQTWGALSVLRAFDRLIVHTDQGLERVSAHIGGAGRIARIPHGLLHDESDRRPPVAARAAADGTVTFLLFGQIKPYKGVDVLLRALSQLGSESRSKCRVRIVGKPYMDTQPLIDLARELGVEDLIRFEFRFVPDEELTAMLDDASMLVFPYREIEASGVLMASIARSRPVIASKLGAFGELLMHGREGLLVPPGDATALARAIDRVIREPGLLDGLSSGMDALRLSIPDWREIARRTVSVYDAARSHWSRPANASAAARPGTVL
jgi:glycosyltransferase involved in cell wall biosynthesis